MGTVGEIMKKLLQPSGPEQSVISENLRNNFRQYGPSLGAYNLEEYNLMARKFYEEHVHSTDPRCSLVRLGEDRIGIDYDGKVRGIYSNDGTPIAFFTPDFREMGFQNRQEMLESWRQNRAMKRKAMA